MSKEMKIEVITYEKERLDYFTDLMKKAHKKYNRLFKKFKDAPILSAYHEVLCNAGRESQFHCDVVEMLEKGYRKQSEGEWVSQADGTHYCSNCGHDATYTFDGTEVCGVACSFCGAKMKGGK